MVKWMPERVKELRKRYGDIKRVFGARLGVSEDMVWEWESGKRSPTKTIALLLDRLEEDLNAGQPRPAPVDVKPAAK